MVLDLRANIAILNKLNGLSLNEPYRLLYVYGDSCKDEIAEIKQVELDKIAFVTEHEELTLNIRDIIDIFPLNKKYFDFSVEQTSYIIASEENDCLESEFNRCYEELENIIDDLHLELVGKKCNIRLVSGESFKALVVSLNVKGIDLIDNFSTEGILKIPKLVYDIRLKGENPEHSGTYSGYEIKEISTSK